MGTTGLHIYLDTAQAGLLEKYAAHVDGFTTNPTLMKEAGWTNYAAFLSWFVGVTDGKPISCEVVADDFPTMACQAEWLHSQAPNLYVKIPITNTKGEWSTTLIHALASKGIKVNVTAILTAYQAQRALEALRLETPSIISIFAGRIADTGVNPFETLRTAVHLSQHTNAKVLWASAREVLNVSQADDVGCDIITLTPNLLEKLALDGKDLTQYSLETVQMFYDDAQKAGLTL